MSQQTVQLESMRTGKVAIHGRGYFKKEKGLVTRCDRERKISSSKSVLLLGGGGTCL